MSRSSGLNAPALATIVAATLRMNLRRLTVWIFAAVFLLIVWALYRGGMSFGGMTTTGVKLGTNSEYAIAAILGAFSFFLMHFTATLTGDPVVKDVRFGVAPLLRATPLDKRTYLLGKFLGGYISLLSIYGVFLVALALGQLLPPEADKVTLPLRLLPYIKFAILFMLVPTFFVGAMSFAIGTLSGSMKMVYIVVTGLLVLWFLVVGLLADDHLRTLAYLEPSGQAWLAEKVAKSRGNAWLNANPIQIDLGFALNRLALVVLGVLALAVTIWRFEGDGADVEYEGEVRPGRLARALAWALGRHREIDDRYSNWSGAGSIPMVAPAPRGLRLWFAHLRASTVTELRLLAAERSLWIIVPIMVLLSVFTTGSAAGPFNVPVYPVSSEFAYRILEPMLIMLLGTSIFYTGEVFHRDDASGVRGILYATPVANSALLLSKFAAMFCLAVGMVLVTFATAIVTQAIQWYLLDGSFYLDTRPYAELGLRILVPAIVVICGTSLIVNVLVRGRYLAYFSLIFLAGLYVWLFAEGHRSLLANPLMLGHIEYSDMTHLEPYHRALQLRDAYWGSLMGFCLCLACWFMRRGDGANWGSLREHLTRTYFLRRTGLFAIGLSCLASSLWFGRAIHAEGTLRGTRGQSELDQLALEDAYLAELHGPSLSYESIDVEVDLWPALGTLDVRGTLLLTNHYPDALDRARFTVDPLFDIRRFELSRQRGEYTLDRGVLTVEFDPPLRQGEQVSLALDWSGSINPGISRDSGQQSTFIHDSATFINSFGPQVVPVPGISSALFLTDPERRRDHGRAELVLLRDRSGGFAPGVMGSLKPFSLRASIEAPAHQTVLCAGERISELPSPRGAQRRRHLFESSEPLYSFAILAAEYELRERGDDQVWFHPPHTYNVETVLDALADSRAFYGESFGPYPHRRLRVVEFPRLASFAQSYPTLMPYSESIGFLTNWRDDSRFVDATYFVTAHEVAHQWWGYITNPGASPGAQVLIESLAEYSAMVLVDERRGEREHLIFLKREEDAYLRRRDPDRELPLAELQFEGQELWYNKGCLVLHMLECQIGRERMLQGLASYVARWRHDPEKVGPGVPPGRRFPMLSHPTIEDLLESLRSAHAGQDLEWFYQQWFREVTIPDMALVGEPLLRSEGGSWSVEFEAANLGEGSMPVRVELVQGTWRADEQDSMREGEYQVSPPLRLFLEPGQTARGTLSATFEPDAIVLDRGYECLDFDRTNNVRTLSVREAEGASGGAGGDAAPAARN